MAAVVGESYYSTTQCTLKSTTVHTVHLKIHYTVDTVYLKIHYTVHSVQLKIHYTVRTVKLKLRMTEGQQCAHSVVQWFLKQCRHVEEQLALHY